MIVTFELSARDTGAPLPGISPQFTFFSRRNLDGSVTDFLPDAPTIADDGGGMYEFDLDDSLLIAGTIFSYVIDCTEASAEGSLQDHVGASADPNKALINFFVFDQRGALLPDLDLTFAMLRRRNADASISDLTGAQPAIISLTGGLYETQLDIADGTVTRYVVDCGLTAAGRYLEGSAGDATASLPPPSPTAPVFVDGAWGLIEDALRAWVMTATGYDAAHVIFSEQTAAEAGGARPSKPYATIRLGDVVKVGIVDKQESVFNGARPNGQEWALTATGLREFRGYVQVFSDSTTGDHTARAMLTRAQLALSLSSVRATLRNAGCSAFDEGAVQNLTAVVGTAFESRAAMDVGFYTMLRFTEYVGYFATFDLKNYMGPPKLGTRNAIDI